MCLFDNVTSKIYVIKHKCVFFADKNCVNTIKNT